MGGKWHQESRKHLSVTGSGHHLLRIAGWQIYHFTDRTGASEIIETVDSVLQVFARPAVA